MISKRQKKILAQEDNSNEKAEVASNEQEGDLAKEILETSQLMGLIPWKDYSQSLAIIQENLARD